MLHIDSRHGAEHLDTKALHTGTRIQRVGEAKPSGMDDEREGCCLAWRIGKAGHLGDGIPTRRTSPSGAVRVLPGCRRKLRRTAVASCLSCRRGGGDASLVAGRRGRLSPRRMADVGWDSSGYLEVQEGGSFAWRPSSMIGIRPMCA